LAQIESVLLVCGVLCYLAATILLWGAMFFGADDRSSRVQLRHEVARKTGLGVLAVGVLLHGLSLLGQGAILFQYSTGVAGLFGWMLGLACLVFARLERGVPAAFVTPVALLASLYSLADPPLHRNMQARVLEQQWLAFHVVVWLIGYAALAFAFASSLIYLWQETLLKRKQLRGLWLRLPALTEADETIFRATSFGLMMLTLGLATAFFSTRWHPQYAPLRDPKVLVSLATWFIFAVYIGVRQGLGWRGRRTNMVVVYGFVLLAVSFFGVPHLVGGQ
jgi:ABC-type uncharacterized transport system permease subunit